MLYLRNSECCVSCTRYLNISHMNKLTIEIEQSPKQADLETISLGLQSHNKKHIGDAASEEELTFAVFARNDVGEVIGGLRAIAEWDWLNIELIWVDEDYRNMQIGKQLLEKAEAFAIENKVFNVSLETGSFQAREFYEKQGYEIFGTLDDYPIGHTMYYMKKSLSTKHQTKV